MKKSLQFIYAGLFTVLLGFAGKNDVLPSWLIFLIGGFLIFYGTYLCFKIEEKIILITKSWKHPPSKNVIGIGITLLSILRIFDISEDYFTQSVIILIVGALITLYGVILLLKEKRSKNKKIK